MANKKILLKEGKYVLVKINNPITKLKENNFPINLEFLLNLSYSINSYWDSGLKKISDGFKLNDQFSNSTWGLQYIDNHLRLLFVETLQEASTYIGNNNIINEKHLERANQLLYKIEPRNYFSYGSLKKKEIKKITINSLPNDIIVNEEGLDYLISIGNEFAYKIFKQTKILTKELWHKHYHSRNTQGYLYKGYVQSKVEFFPNLKHPLYYYDEITHKGWDKRLNNMIGETNKLYIEIANKGELNKEYLHIYRIKVIDLFTKASFLRDEVYLYDENRMDSIGIESFVDSIELINEVFRSMCNLVDLRFRYNKKYRSPYAKKDEEEEPEENIKYYIDSEERIKKRGCDQPKYWSKGIYADPSITA
jgi:hypothetical protein